MTLWFSATAIIPELVLMGSKHIAMEAAWLTNAVQSWGRARGHGVHIVNCPINGGMQTLNAVQRP